MSIRGRLLAMLLAGLTVVLVAGGAAVHGLARASLVRQLDTGLEGQAKSLASLVTFDDETIEFELDHSAAETLDGAYFEIRTLSGEFLRRSEGLAGAALPVPDALDVIAFDDTLLPDGAPGRVVWLKFSPRVDEQELELTSVKAESPDLVMITLAVDRGPVDRAIATLMTALIVVGAVLALTLALLVIFGVGWGLRPLDQLSGQIGGVSGETISLRLDDGGAPRELQPVYDEVNRMLDRVEQTLSRERSFAGAAAHELRTPLAELRSTAEVALRWPDADRAAAALAETLSIGREMEHLVESLLLISRGDVEKTSHQAGGVPVVEIVTQCVTRAGDEIRRKTLDVEVDVDGGHALPAPRDAIEIIVRNLIDNAVHYTPPSGSVAIRNGDAGLIVVENGPVALGAGDLEHLFEPFWRKDSARSDRRHAGLGLAVVQQIARAIGMRIDAELAGDRLRMRLRSDS